MDVGSERPRKYPYTLLSSPRVQLWTVIGLFILITLHYYDDQTGFAPFAFPDEVLGITRHTIDRILYLIPIMITSFAFGSRGGLLACAIAFMAMAPRAIYISSSPTTALLETFLIAFIGSIIPSRIEYYEKQGEKLDFVMERLESTQRRLRSKVRMSMEQGRQLAFINSFSVMLSQPMELKEVIDATVDMVMDLMQVEVVMLFSLDDADDRLRLIAHKGIQDTSARALDGIRCGEGLCGAAAETGVPMKVDNILDNDKLCSLPVLEERLRAQLSVPLMAQGRIMGTLCVATRSERQLKDSDVELLSALGNLIGVAMRNARLYRQRETATTDLALSEKKYRQLFENAHDAIWVQDFDGTIIGANEAAAELFGYDNAESLTGTDSKRFFSGEALELSLAMQKSIVNGHSEHQPYQQEIVKKDGSQVFVMLTTNLISSNHRPDALQFIGRDITNEVKMQENQGFYLKQVTKAHEDERQRISRDLHDSTAQDLIAVIRELEGYCKTHETEAVPEIDTLWQLHGQLKAALQDVRRLSRDLRPSIIDDLGLLPAVEWLVEQLKAEHGVEATFAIAGQERRFSPEVEVTIFRIIQEALRNVAKHADATEVYVIIAFGSAETRVTVTDNGKGFEVPESMGELSRVGKLGVDGMRTRARFAGGSFSVTSEPGKGTTVSAVIPA